MQKKLNTSTYPNNEHALCQEQIKYLREENSSKNFTIKILSEKWSPFKECLLRQSKPYKMYHDFNVPFKDPQSSEMSWKERHTAQFSITKLFFKFGF